MSEFTVQVIQEVTVKLDEAKFTEEFMNEFREYFYDFDDLADHAKHIAQLAAREMLREDFTEGYGPLADMGISATVDDQWEEIV